jgi:hypothetical protein
MQAKRGRAPVRPAVLIPILQQTRTCLEDEWALMSWTEWQGETCEDNLCTHSDIQIYLPTEASPGFLWSTSDPFPTAPHNTQTPHHAQDLPLVGLTSLGCSLPPPTCNHLSLQVCSPVSEAKSRREEVRTREGPRVLQAGPRLQEN